MIPKMMMTTVRMKTRMEPSIATTLYTSSIEESPSNVPTEFQREYPTVSSDEPYLYLLPKTIHATYQPLPFFLKATLGFLSLMIAYVSTWQRQLTWLHPLLVIKNKQVNIVKGLAFFSKVLILYSIGRVIMQDVFTPPSRITTTSLQTNYWLPSSLSTYSNGIHSLQYHSKPSMSAKFQAMHLNHGFGASSLSWLPAIPKLAERLHVRHTMAHDAPGFGFTDSSKDRRSDTSSDIGIQLIQEIIGNDQESLLLMGHSMGALTTLQMVAKLPKTTKLWIVLVAPALGLRKKSSGNNGESKIIEQRLLDPVIEYVLKRVVGSRDFWKRGLRLAWGDPSRISDGDALRFQWPSIRQGWEQGLLRFSRAQSVAVDERGILQQVLNRPNTRLVVIHGSKDRVISNAMLYKGLIPGVQVIQLDGQGHDPFEEDMELFVSTVEEWIRNTEM